MIFGSVCSGIEAASSAWHPLGWTSAWYAEIEPFPSAVLAHRHPGIPNHGDFTRLIKDQPASVDVLVGGTPCQSFSVAGLRGGLTDHRGNLALAFMALVDVLRPRWVVWENVPGVLSSNGGRDFGSILGALGQLGYGFAYRVLDAQYFGLAQRRKRVFLVGHLGGWRRAAAVLFEPEGVLRDSPPRREAGARTAGALGTGTTSGGGWRVGADEAAAGHVVPEARAYGGNNTAGSIEVATAVNAKGGTRRADFESETFVAHTLRGTGHDASEDGTGRGVPLVPVENWRQTCECGTSFTGPMSMACPGCGEIRGGWTHGEPVAFMPSRTLAKDGGIDERFAVRDVCDAVHTSSGGGNKAPLIIPKPPAVAFNWQSGGDCQGLRLSETTQALTKMQTPAVMSPTMEVRRLTCVEMERLMGFPDDHTAIPWRGKPASECPDGPRAKALGNSMAVPVMRWIGRRIALVDGER